jgi:hypothetical protein
LGNDIRSDPRTQLQGIKHLEQTVLDAAVAAHDGCPFFRWLIDRVLQQDRTPAFPRDPILNHERVRKWESKRIRLELAWGQEDETDFVAARVTIVGVNSIISNLGRFMVLSPSGMSACSYSGSR